MQSGDQVCPARSRAAGSEYPVVDLRIVGFRGGLIVIPPLLGWPSRRALRPREQWEVNIAQVLDLSPLAMAGLTVEHSAVIEFTDVEGYRWRRVGHKLPTQIK
jgi:hypothetical protein